MLLVSRHGSRALFAQIISGRPLVRIDILKQYSISLKYYKDTILVMGTVAVGGGVESGRRQAEGVHFR